MEEEFATKEDLEAIKADPRLSRYFTAVQAGVTKKFQAEAEEKKKLQETIQTLQSQVAELDEALTKWETWRSQNEELLNEYAQSRSGEEGNQRGSKGRGTKAEDKGMEDRLNQIVEALNNAGRSFGGKMAQLEKLVNYTIQLTALNKAHPDMDPMKVLDVAIKKKYNDLSKAYMDDEAYGKEVFEGKVKEGVDQRFKEEEAKRKTNVEPGSGSFPIKLGELKQEIGGGFEEEGRAFLAERENEASK